MKRTVLLALGWAIAVDSMAQSSPQASMAKIRVTIDGTAFTGTLNDNPTAKDFLSLLLRMFDVLTLRSVS